MQKNNRGISAFTVILLMTVMAFVGIAVIPSLDVSYLPDTTKNNISVSFSWPGVSERIVETEATSKLEAVLSGIRNCTSVSSVSSKGSGRINLKFRKGTDMAATRFEIASRIRNIYTSLPDGVSYPGISLGTRGTGGRTDLIYVFKSALPSIEIEKYVNSHIILPISNLKGVANVKLGGGNPYEVEILFDADICAALGITASDIRSAYASFSDSRTLGLVKAEEGIAELKLKGSQTNELLEIPIKNVYGRLIYLRDIAKINYKESEPDSYFRLNGLNTLSLSISIDSEDNLLSAAAQVRKKMDDLSRNFPDDISVILDYDSSDYISQELTKIAYRTLLCLLILLLFVFLVYRSFAHLAIVFANLIVNILVAMVIYKLLGLSIHIYTLAGITVSLGIIIDSTIVMADHYSYYRNRSVFPALLGATATTIAALCVVLLLPEEDKNKLVDFSKVIIINLCVSLLMAYLFVPSLIDRFGYGRKLSAVSFRRKRRIIRFNHFYLKYIQAARKRRWIAIVIMITVFGLPLCFLPDKIAENKPKEEQNILQRTYNSIMGWTPYADNRYDIDKYLGGSIALFDRALDKGDFYREFGRDILYIKAGMPEGCTVTQLNEVVKAMENYLSQFNEIESFSTRIVSHDDALIEVSFRKEYENTSFPAALKSQATAMASNFGGANWRIWGINDSYFNNDVTMKYKSNRIELGGYNYDELSVYADILLEKLAENKRVSAPELMNGYYSFAENEFNMQYDFASLAARGISPYGYFTSLESILYDNQLGPVMYNDIYTPVVLRSSNIETFDLWNIQNNGIQLDSLNVKLSEVGKVEKKRSGIDIRRNNQSYIITIGFEFIGSYELAKKFAENTVKEMNEQILPVGYKAKSLDYSPWREKQNQYAWLILLIIVIIYVMCSIIFESLSLPFAVIMMIPLSFIGVFLTFGLSDFVFDQGGFAALVMLSGIVVNAAIYIINEYQGRKQVIAKGAERQWKIYIKSFNHKIYPVLLTVISSILAMTPFLIDGPDEVFWFAFAAGTMGGLVLSLLAIFLYLPLFIPELKSMSQSDERISIKERFKRKNKE